MCNRLDILSCKLATPQLRERKATVLASLRKQVLEKCELSDGFMYKFPGTDEVIDELTTFIKTERLCCDFFTFTLTTDGKSQTTTLTITGSQGAKEFIQTELEL